MYLAFIGPPSRRNGRFSEEGHFRKPVKRVKTTRYPFNERDFPFGCVHVFCPL